MCKKKGFGTSSRIEYALSYTFTITKVNENDSPVVTSPVGPAHQSHFRAWKGVLFSKRAAGVRPLPTTHGLDLGLAARLAHRKAPLAARSRSSAASVAIGTRLCSPVFISRSTASPADSSFSPAMTT